MDAADAHIFTIPAGHGFVDALAAGLWRQAGHDPLRLSRATVLLPTRRSVRALREAFLRLGDGRPMLLPAMRALGDEDDGEVALNAGLTDDDVTAPIGVLQRQFLLARLIVEMGRPGPAAAPMAFDQALRLAQALADLIDQIHTEGLDFAGFETLVPDELADHWQVTLRFLEILTAHWPAILAATGSVDPAVWRNRVLARQAEAWRRQPPADPVIIAGSTGSIPATVGLMAAVLTLPAGAVVLPGLPADVDEATWTAIKADPAHPHHGMAQLLDHLGVTPAAVRPWSVDGSVDGALDDPGGAPTPARRARIRLLHEALRPAAVTERWRRLAADAPEIGAAALDGLTRIDCPDARGEALVIALCLREALETPGKRAAVITADRGLARRIKSELRRWDIEIDDSAGEPLARGESGSFLRLVADMVQADLAPVALLAALKHPLAAGGQAPARFKQLVRQVERSVLRGPRPAAGLAGLRALAAAEGEDGPVRALLAALAAPVAEFSAALAAPDTALRQVIEAHVTLAEVLAASDEESGADRLWRGDGGEAAAVFIAELLDIADDLTPSPAAYVAMFTTLLAQRVVRPRHDRHPRLALLGPLEARLQSYDLVIVGGLNEGSMPPDIGGDPWMSRPMRRAFGLPALERRIGLSAHDFLSAAAAPEVILTRAQRVDGSPTEPSRWLLRLDAVIQALRLPPLDRDAWLWTAWAAALDQPGDSQRIAPPAPCPPQAARPRRYSVTEIETLQRDPYAIYARRVLRLAPLDPLDADPGAADRGVIIHAILERFCRAYPDRLPDDALARLLALGAEAFAELPDRPGIWAFWWPRFERVAAWFVEVEEARRADIAQVWSEVSGALTLDIAGRDFTLTTKIDRIERDRDGRFRIIDYKTGAVPTAAMVGRGLAPQLPLEALILAAGGLVDVPAGRVAELGYWRLSGLQPAGEMRDLEAPDRLIAEAEAGVRALLTTFDDPATPFLSLPNPAVAPRFGDYWHLARVKEWGLGE